MLLTQNNKDFKTTEEKKVLTAPLSLYLAYHFSKTKEKVAQKNCIVFQLKQSLHLAYFGSLFFLSFT